MKIIFIAPNYYPHIGGVEKHIRELSNEIIKDGHKVTLFVKKHDNSYKNCEEENGLNIIRYKNISGIISSRVPIFNLFFKSIKEIISADVIHFHDYYTLWTWYPLPFYLFKLMGKKVYITFHGWEGNCPPDNKTIKRRKICEKAVNGNICVGHYIEKWYGTKADIVSYGGVHRVEKYNNECKDVVFVGRIAEDTGIKEYIYSWKKINEIYPELKLLICGDGILREELENYIKINNIKNIEFVGFVLNPESYIEKAKIVLTAGYLGILEAFAQKKAVISVYNNELKKDYLEMIPNSDKMFWIAKDEKEIIEAIKEAFNDKIKVENSYKFSTERSWKAVKEAYYMLWGKK